MEDSNYNPGEWAGHSFKDAKKAYADHAGRSYAKATAAKVVASSLVADRLKTESTAPLVVMVDVTGSMGTWPTTIFSKLGLLDTEGKSYFPDIEFSFAAVGDVFNDKYPVQIRPFGKGLVLKDELEALVVEGGGGGTSEESYEMGALYYANNVDMPNAVKPIFIFIADEAPYPGVTVANAAKHAKVNIGQEMTVDEIFAALKAKYSVYLVHKHYAPRDTRSTWVRLVGEDHIVDLQDPSRVVDVIFGILAQEAGKVDYFHKEIEHRQDPDQVKVVYEALKTVHLPVPATARRPGMSRMHGTVITKKSGDLL